MDARYRKLSHGLRGKKRIKFVFIGVICGLMGLATAYAVKWYHGFYHHVTPEELSHEVKHSAFQATIRSGPALNLQLYQQEHAKNQPLVLFTSGDGGWSPFCADVAAHIAAKGNFASPQKPVSAEQLTRDYDAIARASIAQAGVDGKAPVVLAGWSLGAGYSVIVATQPQFTFPLSEVIAIGLPTYGELAWKSTDAFIHFTHGRPNEKFFDAHQYLKQLNQTPIVFLYRKLLIKVTTN